MRTILCGGLLVASASISDAAFRLTFVDLGGGGGLSGSPIEITSGVGNFYQDAAGDNYAPTAADIMMHPSLQWDSYIAIDSIGPSTPTYTSMAPGGSQPPGFDANNGHFDTVGSLEGGWSGDAQAVGNPLFGGSLTAFFAQLTVPVGETVSGASVVVTTTGNLPGNSGTRTLTLDGAPNGRLCGISYKGDTTIYGDSYYCYIYEIPAPGAAGVIGIGMLGMMRRRRVNS